MLIGVTVRTNQDDYFVHKSYTMMLEKNGFDYDFITKNTELTKFDGFLITGGYDLDPQLYKQENYASFGIDNEMDILDKKVILFALDNKKPLLGICRGLQSINVFLGGTLWQNVNNHNNENHFIIWNDHYYLVNSFHHQTIAKVAPEIEVLAKSLDGEIEIIRYKNIYGIQFHPELMDFPIKSFFTEP